MARSLRCLGQVVRLGLQEASNSSLAISAGASPLAVAAAAAERGLVTGGSALRIFGRQRRGMAGHASSGHHKDAHDHHAESTPTGLHPDYTPEMVRELPTPPQPKPYSPGVFGRETPIDRSVAWIEKDPFAEAWNFRRTNIANEFRWDFRTTFELFYIWFGAWYLFYAAVKFWIRHSDKRSGVPECLLWPDEGWVNDEGFMMADEREFYGYVPIHEKPQVDQKSYKPPAQLLCNGRTPAQMMNGGVFD